MMNKDFCIAAVKVENRGNAKLRRILDPGIYLLNDSVRVVNDQFVLNNKSLMPTKLYPKNIMISAIVGENGSGKSSLLDIMYRVINNFSWIVFAYKERTAADELYYVPDLYATVYFIKDGKLGEVCSQGDTVEFHYDADRVSFRISSSETFTEKDIRRIQEIVSAFCYTIVTNYSIQAFNRIDYADDKSYLAVSNQGSTIDSSAIWIDSLFHKNDGYMVPIVLNPYRHNSTIDMEKEAKLTKSRVAALLINGTPILPGYHLNDIEYTYNPEGFLSKFSSSRVGLNLPPEGRSRAEVVFFRLPGLLENPNSVMHIVLSAYRMGITSYVGEQDVAIACVYLVYKTLLIASRYPSYEEFRIIGDIDRTFDEQTSEEYKQLLRQLVKKINGDKSHITLKIAQIKSYIRWRKSQAGNHVNVNSFKVDDYTTRELRTVRNTGNIYRIMRSLPPSFFDFEISLKRNGSESPVKLGELSSGERQLMYNLSTFSYHLLNLDSVRNKDRIKYTNANLVLDEVELCFHPELQRKFVNFLISILESLPLRHNWNFNIILATHSPFILSDIPKSNILYLKDGHTEQVKLNPFGGNICDTLRNSFFLHDGFHGEYVKRKINDLIDYLSPENKNNENTVWNERTAKEFVDAVGDEMIRMQLQALYGSKFHKNTYIQYLEEELKKAKRSHYNEEDMA